MHRAVFMQQRTNEKGLDEIMSPKSYSKRKTTQKVYFSASFVKVCLKNKGKLELIKTTKILTVQTMHNTDFQVEAPLFTLIPNQN